MNLYDEMADMATEVLTEFAQGAVSLERFTTTPGENEWDQPTETMASYGGGVEGVVRGLRNRVCRRRPALINEGS